MAGQFNIPGWDPTTTTYTNPRSVAGITKGADLDTLRVVKDMMSRTPSVMSQQATITPEKAQILDEIFSRPKNIFMETKPSVTSKELSNAIKEAGGVRGKTFNQMLTNLDKKLGDVYKKAIPNISKPSKKAVAKGMKAGRVVGKVALPFDIASAAGTIFGDNPNDEKVAAGLSLLGDVGMIAGRSPYITVPSTLLSVGAGTYPLWREPLINKIDRLEQGKQLKNTEVNKLPENNEVDVNSEEIITEPLPLTSPYSNARIDSVTNFVNGLTNGSNVQPNITNQNVSTPEAIQQQFQYETPQQKEDYLNRLEQFANNYPAMAEQERRRQMQAALLAPVINNDKFVQAATSGGPIETTAKQIELLNTAANARVSEAQRPLLAQAFAKAGMPPELAYASDDQLKSMVNLLVATTQAETGRYKAGLDAAARRYVADMKNRGLNAELSLKYGPRGMMKEAMKSMLTPEEYNNWLKYMDKAAPAIDRMHSGSPVVTNWGDANYVVPGERDYFPPNL